MPPFFSCISQLRCNFSRDKQKELDFKKSNSFCSNSHSCSKSVPLLLCRTPLSCECLFYFLVYGSFSLPSSISRVFLFSFLFFSVFRFFCAKSAHSGSNSQKKKKADAKCDPPRSGHGCNQISHQADTRRNGRILHLRRYVVQMVALRTRT